MKLEGVFLYYDKENGNGRIYTKECAEDIVEQFKKMKEGNCLGEITPPQSGRPEVQLSQVSHRIDDVWLDENTGAIKGRLEILDGTPKGVMLKTLIEKLGTKVFSIASRGVGTLNENNEVEDYELMTFDIVRMEESSTKGPIQISDL